MSGLEVLVVDDELPTLDELAYLLRQDHRIARVRSCDSAAESLRILKEQSVDAVFLDIQMPGLSGLELAEVLRHFKQPPPIVFVTAHDEHAVQAFEVAALDYVLKPVREERLRDAVSRVLDSTSPRGVESQSQIAVELGGVTRFIDRDDVKFAEAQGDYTRLFVGEDSWLVRTPISALENDWHAAGFVRIHRSHLVNLAFVDEVRLNDGRTTVVVQQHELPVSRRHTRELRELLNTRTN